MDKLKVGDKVKILVNEIPQSQGCRTIKWFPGMTGTICDSEYHHSDGSINDLLNTRVYLQSELGPIPAGLMDVDRPAVGPIPAGLMTVDRPAVWFYHKDLLRIRKLFLPEELFEWSG